MINRMGFVLRVSDVDTAGQRSVTTIDINMAIDGRLSLVITDVEPRKNGLGIAYLTADEARALALQINSMASLIEAKEHQ